MNIHKLSEFNYNLPTDRIASKPLDIRSESKLMNYKLINGTHSDNKFSDILKILKKGDLLIMNNTKVIPARMYLNKETGGKVEILFDELLEKNNFKAIFSSSRPPKIGSKLHFNKEEYLEVYGIQQNYLILKNKSKKPIFKIFEDLGEVPLPKYIKRPPSDLDDNKYQTVYAEHDGSVAAPTAGLHFTKEIIQRLLESGIKIKFLTLHITYNTFKPISDDDYTKHDIGKEYFNIDKSVFKEMDIAKKTKKRIIAVGTTVARSLEYCLLNKINSSYEGYVDLFIYPGHEFKAINALLTNFHLPKSSLLLLVCAFAGTKNILDSYQYAIANKYRFYSYGDSMFLDNT